MRKTGADYLKIVQRKKWAVRLFLQWFYLKHKWKKAWSKKWISTCRQQGLSVPLQLKRNTKIICFQKVLPACIAVWGVVFPWMFTASPPFCRFPLDFPLLAVMLPHALLSHWLWFKWGVSRKLLTVSMLNIASARVFEFVCCSHIMTECR